LSVCVVVLFAAGCRGADHHPDSGAPVSTASTTPVVPSTNPPAEAAPAHLRCHTSNLSVRLGRKTQVFAEQYSIPVVFTNHSDRPCSMVGFPGVDLQGPPDPEPTTSLTRAVDSTPEDGRSPTGRHCAQHTHVSSRSRRKLFLDSSHRGRHAPRRDDAAVGGLAGGPRGRLPGGGHAPRNLHRPGRSGERLRRHTPQPSESSVPK
jgi:hypothetical protein